MKKEELRRLQLPPLEEIISSVGSAVEEKRKDEPLEIPPIPEGFSYFNCSIKKEHDGNGEIQLNKKNSIIVCKYAGAIGWGCPVFCSLTDQPCPYVNREFR